MNEAYLLYSFFFPDFLMFILLKNFTVINNVSPKLGVSLGKNHEEKKKKKNTWKNMEKCHLPNMTSGRTLQCSMTYLT